MLHYVFLGCSGCIPYFIQAFNQAVELLANRDESADWNPYLKRNNTCSARVYARSGAVRIRYKLFMDDYSEEARSKAGDMWFKNSSWVIDGDEAFRNEIGIRDRVKKIDTFVHLQDLAETDVLMAADYGEHEGGSLLLNLM